MKDLKTIREEINGIDVQMARLFEQRMNLSREVAAWKAVNGLPVFDPEREARILEANTEHISDPALREYYASFLQRILDLSKDCQNNVIERMK